MTTTTNSSMMMTNDQNAPTISQTLLDKLRQPDTRNDAARYVDFLIDDYYDRLSRGEQVEAIKERNRLMFGITDDGEDVTTWEQLCTEHDIENLRPTDALHAELLVNAHKDKLRIVQGAEGATRYLMLDKAEGIKFVNVDAVEKLAADSLPVLVTEHLADLGYYQCIDTPPKFNQSIAQWLTKALSTHNTIETAVRGIPSFDRSIVIEPNAVDSSNGEHYYGFGGGVINVDTGEIITHEQAFEHNLLITKRLMRDQAKGGAWQCDTIGQAGKAREFLAFIEWMTQGDKALEQYLQLCFGAALVGDFNDETIIYLHGNGNNGKGVLLRTMYRLFGDYATHTGSKILLEAGQRNSTAERDGTLLGAISSKLWVVAEVKEGHTFNDELIKSLKDGGQYRRMNVDASHAAFSGMLIIGGNHEPRCADDSNGMRRRMKFVPCLGQLEADKVDADLEHRLIANEAPHIMAWVLDGARHYIQLTKDYNGIPPLRNPAIVPACVVEKTETYWGKQDFLGDFVRSYFAGWRPMTKEQAEADKGGISFGGIAKDYNTWLEENDEGSKHERAKVTATTLRNTLPNKLKQCMGWNVEPARITKHQIWGLKLTNLPEGHFLGSNIGAYP
jgi:P4 family phage/plasmid primase-like protien